PLAVGTHRSYTGWHAAAVFATLRPSPRQLDVESGCGGAASPPWRISFPCCRESPHRAATSPALGLSVLRPRRGVPDPRRVVPTPGKDALAVGAERHAADLVRVSLKGSLLLPRLGVPDPRRVVPAPGEDALAVGAERHAADLVRVSPEGGL